MGPTLLLDKCAFQCLSRNELYAASGCFHINVPPILTLEIVADLKKTKGLVKETPHEEVKMLSDKMLALFDAYHNAHYRFIAEGETQGSRIELRGVPALSGGKRKTLSDGSHGVIFDEHPDRARLRRWASGEFSPDDEAQAEQWRQQSAKLNIEQIRNELWRKVKGLPKPQSLADAMRSVDEFLAKAPQFSLLQTLVDVIQLKNALRERAVARWRYAKPNSLRTFLPYGHHVLRTVHLYTVALAYGLVGTRATNVLDLEYLFYLPFCRVFSSGDKFVAEMATTLLRPEQVFLDRDSLKRDMRAVSDYYDAEGDNRTVLVNGYDAGENGVFEHAVWKINQPPWKRENRNLAPQMSEEAKQKLLARFKEMTG